MADDADAGSTTNTASDQGSDAPKQLWRRPLYESLTTEVSDVELKVTGEIPDWVNGMFYKNGPALFEFGKETFDHWFDGQAMLHGFNVNKGVVKYTNKFLDSTNLRAHRAAGRIAVSEFGTDPCRNIFGRFAAKFQTGNEFQNANVSIKQMAGKLVALTEVPLPMEFESDTLATVGPVRFGDKLVGHMSTAHPHVLPDGKYINYITVFGKTPYYLIYSVDPANEENTSHKNAKGETVVERTVIAKVPRKNPSYMHSFAATENYIVLVEFPWKFSLGGMLKQSMSEFFTGHRGEQGPLAMFEWKPKDGTRFTVVKITDGCVVGEYYGPAFFCYHHINAFETEKEEIVIDMMCYDKPGYSLLKLKQMREGAVSLAGDNPNIRRFSLNLNQKDSDKIANPVFVIDEVCELPTINYSLKNTKADYTYVYGIGEQSDTFGGFLVKINIETKEKKVWKSDKVGVSEPIMIPRPDSEIVDDGVVISICFDGNTKTSFLLILDAATFEEIARAPTPHVIPMGLHGIFVGDSKM